MPDESIPEPQQRFTPQPEDPKWLLEAVRFHGHLGPWAAAGLRIGQAVLADLGCQGYFDVQIDVAGPIAKPPPRCIVDGLQFSTGATYGKDGIRIELSEQFEIRAANTRTGKTFRYRLTREFLEAVRSLSGHEHVESLARQVARQPFERIAERAD